MTQAPQPDAESRAYLEDVARRAPPVPLLDVRALRLAERAGIPPVPFAHATVTATDCVLPGPAGSLPARRYRPPNGHGGTLAFFHGGGFVLGDLETHDGLCRALAHGSGCDLVSVAYRLAPEHPLPAAIEDARAALRAIAAAAPEPARVGVGGDSAGGMLAADAALWARDRGGPPLAFQLLLYPLTHRHGALPVDPALAEGFLLTAPLMRWFAAQQGDAAWPAPIEAASHRGLPPALVLTAECDPLCAQGAAYARALRADGVEVEHIHCPGVLHGFLQQPHRIARARDALARAGAAMRAALGV